MIYRKPSPIGWTDFSGGNLNFVIGCTPVSEGCQHCYARRWAETWGRDFSRVVVYPEKLEALLTAKFKPPFRNGDRPMCFVCDLGDLFHDDVPDDFIWQALDVFRQRQDVIWQVLTKRPERMVDLWQPFAMPPNVWIGITAETQNRLTERYGWLVRILAPVRFISVEPMLEAIKLPVSHFKHEIEWVVCGGESGPERRPFDKAWALDLWRQCKEAQVPFFFKQGSGEHAGMDDLLDGQSVKEWPR